MSAAFLQIEKRDLPTVALQKARLVSLDQHIVVVKMPDQQRGMYVVLAHILPHRRLRFVGVQYLQKFGQVSYQPTSRLSMQRQPRLRPLCFTSRKMQRFASPSAFNVIHPVAAIPYCGNVSRVEQVWMGSLYLFAVSAKAFASAFFCSCVKGMSSGILCASFAYISTKLKMQRETYGAMCSQR